MHTTDSLCITQQTKKYHKKELRYEPGAFLNKTTNDSRTTTQILFCFFFPKHLNQPRLISFPFASARWGFPLHSTREAQSCHSIHPLSLPGCPAGYCWAALPCLAGWTRPVWSWLAGRRQCPLPHQRPQKELRRWRDGSENSLQQPEPHRLP